MAIQNPPIFLQAGSHPAEDVRRALASLAGTQGGVVGSTDLVVSERTGTPNLSVDVAGGKVWVAGTESAYQGAYFCENRGSENLAISAGDATNGRIDIIVAKVEDSVYSGATDAWSLAVVEGTPAGVPVAPTAPANSVTLAEVLVPAGASSIVNGDITDARTFLAQDELRVAGDLTVDGDTLIVDSSAGRVGVGVTPTAPLHVKGGTSADASPELIVEGVGSISVHSGIGAGSFNAVAQANDKALIFTDGSVDTGNLVFAPWATSPSGMRISSTGKTSVTGGLEVDSDPVLSYIGTSYSTSPGYPATCTGGGAWHTPVNVTCDTDGVSQYEVSFDTTWVNTVANNIIFRVYESGTATTYDMMAGRFDAGQNNASGSVIFTPTAGTRTFTLYFISSTGTMQGYGSEQSSRITVRKVSR